MKVPLSWLRRFVDVDEPLADLVDLMSLHGLEVEEIHTPGAGAAGIRTKRVVSRADHPDADTLQVVVVTDGDDETELVCGAWNFDVGDVVAHAEVGATIPGPSPDRPVRLDARPIRGVVSNGMLCSAAELGLGDDHTGIIVLAEDTPVGVDLSEVLPVGEPVIEVAVLADRGDHHSILGIAREVAAIADRDLAAPQVPGLPGGGPVRITIDAPDGCHHFVTQVVDDVTVGPSPWWLRQRLEQCGIRAINTVVDVTNYVMLELGQPLHAFDLDRLAGPALTVRWATEGETLVTLDDRERRLTASDLVIDDADGPVSLAGVMGGATTEVSESTTRVLIEGAIWDPATIRRTSRRLNLVSEASLRFERRVDPHGARRAVARAVELLSSVAGGTPGGSDEGGAPPATHGPVAVDAAATAGLLGIDDLDADRQARLLRRLGCEVEVDGTRLTVTPPSWRGDLDRPADVAEDVARLHGYEAIPATLPHTHVAGGLSARQRAEHGIRAIAMAAGFHEVRMRPFAGDDVLEGLVPTAGRVTLANPLAQDAAHLAPSLVEGLIQVVRRNHGQGRPGTAVFELARVFRPAGDPIDRSLGAFGDGWRWTGPDGAPLPTQPRVLGIAAHGVRMGPGWVATDDHWDVFDVLAVLDAVVARTGAQDQAEALARAPVEREGWHPGRSARLLLHGVEVGFVGQLHPDETERRDLTEPVVVGELLVEPLLLAVGDEAEPRQAAVLRTHPALTIDVALSAPEVVPYATLAGAVRAGAGRLLDDLWFFDEYRGDQVGVGRRSVAMRLRLQDDERQLTDADAEAVIGAVAREAEAVGATLRR